MPMIIGEIRRYLRDNSTLRVSRSLKDIAYKALKLKELSNNENLSNEEIANLLNLKKSDIDNALEAIIEPFSLYDSVYNDNGDTVVLLDQIKDEKNIEENWIEDIALLEALKTLNEKEKSIINMRYYQGKTQIEARAAVA